MLPLAERFQRAEQIARQLGVDLNACGVIEASYVLGKAGIRPMAGADGIWDTLGVSDDASLEQIGQALRKAAIDTGISADALLSPAQADHFITTVSDSDPFGAIIRVEPVDRASGSIDKIGIASGIIRASAENTDTGYRAAPNFGNVPYQGVGVWLPWEITLQFLRRNIERGAVEDRIWTMMTGAFGRDLSRLDLLGDTGSGDPSLSIDDGILKYLAANVSGKVHRVNCSFASLGVTWPDKKTLFALRDAMPEKYRGGALNEEGQNTSELQWFANPSVVDDWQEELSDRPTSAGDAALGGGSQGPQAAPLGYPWMRIPQFPTNRIVLSNPKNFVRVVTEDIERYTVRAGSDWELTTRRKNGYVFFMDRDAIVEEDDAIVDGYNVGL